MKYQIKKITTINNWIQHPIKIMGSNMDESEAFDKLQFIHEHESCDISQEVLPINVHDKYSFFLTIRGDRAVQFQIANDFNVK